jgi:hypothetical protein
MPKRRASVDFTVNGDVFECGNYCSTDASASTGGGGSSSSSPTCSPVTDWVISQAGHASKCASAGLGDLSFELFVAQRKTDPSSSSSSEQQQQQCVRTTVLELGLLQPWTGHISDAPGVAQDTCTGTANATGGTENTFNTTEGTKTTRPVLRRFAPFFY